MRALALIVKLPLAAGYGALVRLRLLAYRRGWIKSQALGIPAIAIGNLTAGGTGKTPVVSWFLRQAQSAGLGVACLTRGYGRRTLTTMSRVRVEDRTPIDPRAIGDEVAMLAAAHPSIPFFVGASRVESARLARVTDAPRLLVLDDAYQHLRAERDLNVLLVDAQQGFGNGWVLPMGPLREPVREVHRADAVLITKSNVGDPARIEAQLKSLGLRVPVFRCSYLPTHLRRLDGKLQHPAEWLAGKNAALLCGIARPEAFRSTVAALGAVVTAMETRPDHHGYPERDIAALSGQIAGGSAGGDPAPVWVTTEKDAVKLRGRLTPRAQEALWVLVMEAVPDPDAQAFFLDRIRALTVKLP